MRVSKKQLLGFGGLALVVGLTTFAYNLPAEATSAGGAVNVQVDVYNTNFETVINSPLDGEIFTDSVVSFSETHSNANNVKYYLTHIAEDGAKTEHELKDYEASGESVNGKTQFALDLDEYGGYGKYIFRSVVTAANGQTKEDSAQFMYVAIEADQEDIKSDSESVSFKVKYSAGVKSLVYQIFDAKGNAVSKEFTVLTTNPENGGVMDINLALLNEGINLESGRYTVVINGYSAAEPSDESYVGVDSIYFDYTAPESPNVPDTGSIFTALNIAKADYLITGVVCFSIISLAALLVIKKSKKDV